MAVELAEIAAGLPMVASFALAGGITTLREGRRRSALNEAMHELRRPMQALSLVLPGDSGAADSSLRLAAAALERLDREINGKAPAVGKAPVSFPCLLEEAVRRWSTQAALRGGSLKLLWSGDGATVQGDRFELAQVVDNLISNALEHGGGRVVVEGRSEGGRLRVAVVDSGSPRGRRRPAGGKPNLGGCSRRGHGLRVAARVAKAHGGSFELRRSRQGAEAILWLPLQKVEGEG